MEESIQTVLGVDVFLGLAIAADADADVAVLGSVGGPGSGDFESWVVAELVNGVGDLGVALFAAGLVGAGVDDGEDRQGRGCQEAEKGEEFHVGMLFFSSRCERRMSFLV